MHYLLWRGIQRLVRQAAGGWRPWHPPCARTVMAHALVCHDQPVGLQPPTPYLPAAAGST